MSDDADNTPDDTVESESIDLRCGERLAEARREQQITVLEVAKELHLDEPKVRALERNEFDVLGAPVFAKGHLRKYSQLVGVDEDDVFADYYAMTRADGMPPIVSRRKKVHKEMSPGPWLVVIAMIIVLAGIYWWFAMRTVATPPVQSAPPAVAEPETSNSDSGGADTASSEMAEPDTAAPRLEQAEQPPPETVETVANEIADEPPEAVEPAATDQIRLTLTFSGECWTEIKDAEGQQLFFSMGNDGQSVELSGKAPISALFGNADNVDVRVNDSAYALPAANSANRTVRVAILSQ